MARPSGWRWLGLFWATLAVLAAAAGITLQTLGPPGPVVTAAGHGPAPESAHPPAPTTTATATATSPAGHAEPERPAAAAPPGPRRDVAGPDPALMERLPGSPTAQLPRVAADGRAARVVYAAPVPPGAGDKPRVALLLGGFGVSDKDSRAALDAIPGPVSFAVSAHAAEIGPLLDAARAAGHELLSSIPMEPQNYPTDDEGSDALMTGLSAQKNLSNLLGTLARTPGAVGATGASDGMRGERFADLSGAFDPILDEIARRGLLYIDPRPGRTAARPGLATRAVDVVVDDSPGRADIEAKLLALERAARERGSALGLVGTLRSPVTLDRVAAWTQGLEAKGLVLVPVSALVPAPAAPGLPPAEKKP